MTLDLLLDSSGLIGILPVYVNVHVDKITRRNRCHLYRGSYSPRRLGLPRLQPRKISHTRFMDGATSYKLYHKE